jgi:hypothetical protein
MINAELQALLAELPPDLPVYTDNIWNKYDEIEFRIVGAKVVKALKCIRLIEEPIV